MPSTDPERDKEKSAPDDSRENPFIKFRRFADEKVGAILHGVIGLPSVFSQRPEEANSRWMDFQDDLKRREKSLGEDRASNVSPTNTAGVAHEDEVVEIPVKKFSGQSLPQSHPPKHLGRPIGEIQRDDFDLFSPVTKALFARVNRSPRDGVDWSKAPILGSLDDTNYPSKNLFDLSDAQKTGSALSMVQSMVYNDLNRTATNRSSGTMHSQSSLLPYVLFSPYSPLVLSDSLPLQKAEGLKGVPVEEFPYCAAFEDLLLCSRGRPMGLWMHVSSQLEWHESIYGISRPSYRDIPGYAHRASTSTESPELRNEMRKARLGMNWITSLSAYGLLSPGPPTPFELFGMDRRRPWYTKTINKAPSENSRSAPLKPEDEAWSEEDMYDEFLDRAASAGFDGPITSEDIEFLIDTAHRSTLDLFRSFTTGESTTWEEHDPINSARRVNNFDFGAFLRGESYFGQKSTSKTACQSTQTETSPEEAQAPQSDIHKATIKELLKNSMFLPRSAPASNAKTKADTTNGSSRVVSSTTTTEQRTNESGTVETIVTIEKIFADGRKFVTVTEHVEVPPTSSRGDEDGETWSPEAQQERKDDGNVGDNKHGNKKDKGWFWN